MEQQEKIYNDVINNTYKELIPTNILKEVSIDAYKSSISELVTIDRAACGDKSALFQTIDVLGVTHDDIPKHLKEKIFEARMLSYSISVLNYPIMSVSDVKGFLTYNTLDFLKTKLKDLIRTTINHNILNTLKQQSLDTNINRIEDMTIEFQKKSGLKVSPSLIIGGSWIGDELGVEKDTKKCVDGVHVFITDELEENEFICVHKTLDDMLSPIARIISRSLHQKENDYCIIEGYKLIASKLMIRGKINY